MSTLLWIVIKVTQIVVFYVHLKQNYINDKMKQRNLLSSKLHKYYRMPVGLFCYENMKTNALCNPAHAHKITLKYKCILTEIEICGLCFLWIKKVQIYILQI